MSDDLRKLAWKVNPAEFLRKLEDARRHPEPEEHEVAEEFLAPVVRRVLIDTEVPGQPRGKGRPRFTKMGRTYTDAKTVKWEREAAQLFALSYARHRRRAYEGPCALEVEAISQRPKNRQRKADPDDRIWCLVEPDGDNVLKIVADAIQRARVIANDKQIVEWRCRRLYGAKKEAPKVIVRLYALEAGT